MNIKKTADLLLNFILKRLAETFGILVSLSGVMLFLALITYSPNDPNFIFPDNTKIQNGAMRIVPGTHKKLGWPDDHININKKMKNIIQ